MSLYISCNIVYFIDSNSPHITFPFYPQIPFDGCAISVQPSPYSSLYICTVEMLQDEKADDSGRPLFAVQGGMRGHNATKEAADSHASVSTGSE